MPVDLEHQIHRNTLLRTWALTALFSPASAPRSPPAPPPKHNNNIAPPFISNVRLTHQSTFDTVTPRTLRLKRRVWGDSDVWTRAHLSSHCLTAPPPPPEPTQAGTGPLCSRARGTGIFQVVEGEGR
eukprot:3940871-Rhodomonas_salina.1